MNLDSSSNTRRCFNYVEGEDTYLPDGSGQKTDDAFMRYSDDTLSVNFNNSVTYSNTAAFGDSPSQQTTNLSREIDFLIKTFIVLSVERIN